MELKYSILILLLLDFTVKGKDFKCATPKQFEENNASIIGQDYKDYKSVKDIKLHEFLFEFGKELGHGSFGEVKEIKNVEPRIVIKKMIVDESNEEEFEREISTLRKLCKQDKDSYANMVDCNFQAIASFYGCVVDNNTLFLFQEYLEQDLASKEAKPFYQNLNPVKKVEAMLDIIDKFIEIHEEDIIHSDIKPANIMTKGFAISNFKIIDFGMANYPGGRFVGGSDGYLPPERYREMHSLQALGSYEDVFALAMTFAGMEEKFKPAHEEIAKGCFSDENYEDKCQKVITNGLIETFTVERKLSFLIPVLEKALNLNYKKRLETMKKFSIELFKEFKNLEGSAKIIEAIKLAGNIYDVDGKSPSFWRNRLIPKQKGTQETFINTSAQPRDRTIKWVNRLAVKDPTKKLIFV